VGLSTAFLTDRYELTMLEAALRSGIADRRATFEVFTRRLPGRRAWGVFAGLGRFLEALEDFQFGPAELEWLERERIVDDATLYWLDGHRFRGHIDAYREGELYTGGSPVMTVESSFGDAVLLETLALSIFNHDSAVAAAASLISWAAGERPLIEMGSRRTDPSAAVAAARAAYLGGFSSTSNLDAGRRYGIPTAGTAAHAFVLAYPSERDAFQAQIEALGPGTTLLVDTFDIEAGIRTAVEVAGPGLGGVRIDSGDLGREAVRARRLLDELGATSTRVIVTGDLDDHTVAALGGAPVDGYGVGTNVVTGLGLPTAGFVYKLVAIADGPDGALRPVAKRSAGKATFGGRKWSWRAYLDQAPARLREGDEAVEGPVWADVVTTSPACPVPGARPLQGRVMEHGRPLAQPTLAEAREFHAQVRRSTPPGHALLLDRRGRLS
jgi:nicotinate phosphoribosyltransferase